MRSQGKRSKIYSYFLTSKQTLHIVLFAHLPLMIDLQFVLIFLFFSKPVAL